MLLYRASRREAEHHKDDVALWNGTIQKISPNGKCCWPPLVLLFLSLSLHCHLFVCSSTATEIRVRWRILTCNSNRGTWKTKETGRSIKKDERTGAPSNAGTKTASPFLTFFVVLELHRCGFNTQSFVSSHNHSRLAVQSVHTNVYTHLSNSRALKNHLYAIFMLETLQLVSFLRKPHCCYVNS